MSSVPEMLAANRRFAETFDRGDLPIRPRLLAIVLTCLDARVDPGRFLGLDLGDAVIMRNAGGRVTPMVLRDMAILRTLMADVTGDGPPTAPELVIIHHTNCGLARFADPAAGAALADRLGIEAEEVADSIAISDPADSVRHDIERLRGSAAVPDALVVSGHVYDVTDGTVAQVVAPAPLRSA